MLSFGGVCLWAWFHARFPGGVQAQMYQPQGQFQGGQQGMGYMPWGNGAPPQVTTRSYHAC